MAFLRAFGAYLPSRVVTNEMLAARLGVEPDWIVSVSGIRERRYAGEQETVADMAVKAARDCLTRAGTDQSRIGLLIVASGSAERRFPGPAVTVAAGLGLAGVPALDLPMASAGSLFGMALADRLAGQYRDVLVVASEKMSTIVDQGSADRNVLILFGDGAGACLISEREGAASIVASSLHSDGAFANDLHLPLQGPLEMNGRSVIMQASRKIPRSIQETLAAAGRSVEDVEVFLMHQANQNLMDRVAQTLEAPAERFFSNISRYGNTSSASMLIAAAEWSQQAGFRPGMPVVFAAFGAGFSWGALLAAG